ncbi:14345_t:CDS:1, partial [Entrophospora sp. SA101]
LNNEITQLSHQLEDQNHEIDDLKKKLIEVQDQNKVPYEQWNSHIEQLSHQLGTQTHEIKDLKKKLVDSYDQLTEAMEKNKVLVEEWNLHFSNQPKRINSIIEIALAERDSLYEDIESLIRNNNRFSLENIMNYTPKTWLNGRNQVI